MKINGNNNQVNYGKNSQLIQNNYINSQYYEQDKQIEQDVLELMNKICRDFNGKADLKDVNSDIKPSALKIYADYLTRRKLGRVGLYKGGCFVELNENGYNFLKYKNKGEISIEDSEKIHHCVENNEQREALKIIQKIKPKYNKHVTILLSQLDFLIKDSNIGSISYEEKKLRWNQLNQSILELIEI